MFIMLYGYLVYPKSKNRRSEHINLPNFWFLNCPHLLQINTQLLKTHSAL